MKVTQSCSAAIKQKNVSIDSHTSHGNNIELHNHQLRRSKTRGGVAAAALRPPTKHRSDCNWSLTAGGGDSDNKMFRVIVEPPVAGTFFAGSDVRGCVQIDIQESKHFKYIHISLTGRAQVCWIDSSSLKEHRAEKEYLHETKMLWTKDDDEEGSVLHVGSHMFPFQFQLPPNIPSSFESRVGSVRYELLGRVVTEIIRKDHMVELDIPVIQVIDINNRPLLVVPQSVHVHKRCWNFPCTISNVSMTVNISRTGFCIGEDIPLNIHLENFSRNEIMITACLKQKIIYTAKKNRRQYDRATVVRVNSHRFSGQTSTIWPTNLRVPLEEAISQDYELINITYSIKVVAFVAWGQKLVAKIPVTIGNIPFGESLVEEEIQNSRDHLNFFSYPNHHHHDNHHQSVMSLATEEDNTSHGCYTLNSQLTPTIPHSDSYKSFSDTVSMTTDSCAHNSECTYSVHDCIDEATPIN